MGTEAALIFGLVFSGLCNVFLLVRRQTAMKVHESDLTAVGIMANSAQKNAVRMVTAIRRPVPRSHMARERAGRCEANVRDIML
ncbi:MAG: hypothetical protein KAX19_14260, partial [Candidatus Brocadiae bacterium]|nr:hypothetical protein [Candidatus Brocadiia bacterium]